MMCLCWSVVPLTAALTLNDSDEHFCLIRVGVQTPSVWFVSFPNITCREDVIALRSHHATRLQLPVTSFRPNWESSAPISLVNPAVWCEMFRVQDPLQRHCHFLFPPTQLLLEKIQLKAQRLGFGPPSVKTVGSGALS